MTAAPGLVVASGSLGFALGAKQPDGRCKYQADYEADLRANCDASGSNIVRIYGADQCNTAQDILPAAKKDFVVILGILGICLRGIPTHSNSDGKEARHGQVLWAAILRRTPGYEGQVYAVIVGSESLYRGIAAISPAWSRCLDFKIGTADSWNKYQDGTADAVIEQADVLLANAFSYWQGQTRDNATACFFESTMQAFGRIQRVSGSTNKPEV
ncbi:glucan 1,3-beta-glucosidase [Colletotrichum graminicola M1.001]|uniref:Glucan 1,3-beta-glucosidase n=1 Tax=Colletotrichum graminicola (strain M1.001 / M2 / FGSC 10212) TaxID=645133 RepID=E3QFA3_COLGM|nr:glucan 1,3-beta-glucosidase [Colletotrichum graminicola M1.001]EFQ29541.1 glucan 1,3-beta-glucosidase [Colletotrichum graminicola M1.001]